MGQPGMPRKKGDELLLAAEGDGWVERDTLIRHIMQFVMPGQAHRTAAQQRVKDDDPRQRDTLRVGSRTVAGKCVANAVTDGAWIREGEKIRHRDWQPQEVAAAVATPAGFVVPTLAEVTAHSTMLHGFTKWHWAAVVACYVVEGEGRGKSVNAISSISPEDFAALGIAGLQSKDTVRRYLHVWLEANDGERPEPGQAVAIPDMDEWPSKRVRKRDREQPPESDEADRPEPRQRQTPWHQRLANTGDPVEYEALLRKHTKIADRVLGPERGAKVSYLKAIPS